MTERRGLKRLVGGIYSAIADGLYEPFIVKGAFRVFGGRLNQTILEWQKDAATFAAGAPILDMPCGTGYFTIELAKEHRGVVVASDLAAGMLRETKRAISDQSVGNVVVLGADAHRLPFANDTFKAIVCWNGLQVIPGLDETLRELIRILAPGGRLYASIVGIPISEFVSARSSTHLPALLSGKHRMTAAFQERGLRVDSATTERLATILTATKLPA